MKMEMATLKRVFAMCKGGNLMESLKLQGKELPCALLLVCLKDTNKYTDSNRRKVVIVYSRLNAK